MNCSRIFKLKSIAWFKISHFYPHFFWILLTRFIAIIKWIQIFANEFIFIVSKAIFRILGAACVAQGFLILKADRFLPHKRKLATVLSLFESLLEWKWTIKIFRVTFLFPIIGYVLWLCDLRLLDIPSFNLGDTGHLSFELRFRISSILVNWGWFFIFLNHFDCFKIFWAFSLLQLFFLIWSVYFRFLVRNIILPLTLFWFWHFRKI